MKFVYDFHSDLQSHSHFPFHNKTIFCITWYLCFHVVWNSWERNRRKFKWYDMYFGQTETNEMAGKTNGTGDVYIYKLQNSIHCKGANMRFYCTILYWHWTNFCFNLLLWIKGSGALTSYWNLYCTQICQNTLNAVAFWHSSMLPPWSIFELQYLGKKVWVSILQQCYFLSEYRQFPIFLTHWSLQMHDTGKKHTHYMHQKEFQYSNLRFKVSYQNLAENDIIILITTSRKRGNMIWKQIHSVKFPSEFGNNPYSKVSCSCGIWSMHNSVSTHMCLGLKLGILSEVTLNAFGRQMIDNSINRVPVHNQLNALYLWNEVTSKNEWQKLKT